MNAKLLQMLTQHPDAILRVIQSGIRAINVKDAGTPRWLSYHPETNTILIEVWI